MRTPGVSYSNPLKMLQYNIKRRDAYELLRVIRSSSHHPNSGGVPPVALHTLTVNLNGFRNWEYHGDSVATSSNTQSEFFRQVKMNHARLYKF